MIYFLKRADGLVKIGYTADYRTRTAELRRMYGQLDLLGLMDGDREKEHQLHLQFANLRIEGEWFSLGLSLSAFIEGNTHSDIPKSKPWETMRTKPIVDKAVEMIQINTVVKLGKRMSANDALWLYIVEHDPELAEQAKQKALEMGLSESEAGIKF